MPHLSTLSRIKNFKKLDKVDKVCYNVVVKKLKK